MTTIPRPMDYPLARPRGCPFDPPPLLKEWQEEAPLTKIDYFGRRVWLVTRYDEMRRLITDPRLSSETSTPGFPDQGGAKFEPSELTDAAFLGRDDPEHSRLRRMVSASFMVKRIEAMRPLVQKIVDDQLDALLAGPKPVDLVQAFALPIPSLVICGLLGVPYADHAFFQENSRVQATTTASAEERTAASTNLARYLNDLIGERFANPHDDLLSVLAERVKVGELTRMGAIGTAMLLLTAGHETTANMIALGTLVLLEQPDQLAKLRATGDRQRIAGMVDELLRYLTIGHHGRRRAVREDIEFDGYLLKAGEGVIFAADIANRDPRAFPDPDRLDLDRDARRHLSFGFGPHQCLGQPLARLELEIVYPALFHRIPTLRCTEPLEDLEFKLEALVYGVRSLPVTW